MRSKLALLLAAARALAQFNDTVDIPFSDASAVLDAKNLWDNGSGQSWFFVVAPMLYRWGQLFLPLPVNRLHTHPLPA